MTRDLVLIGGGHSHALILRSWAMAPLPGVRLTVIDPYPATAYSGMLPGHLAGHYTRNQLDIDLVRLSRFAGARLILGRAEGIDLAAQRIHVAGGRAPIGYDVASLDIGVTSAMPQVSGFAEHAAPAKPFSGLTDRWADWLAGTGPHDLVVIGGGVAGVELMLAAAHALGSRAGRLHLIERGSLLSASSPAARRRLRAALAQAGVRVIEGASVIEVNPVAVMLDDGRHLPATLVIGAAGARPQDWLAGTGLRLTDGFIMVDATLRSSDLQVFACGDCAEMTESPRPRAGVFAVRQAPVLLCNLRAALSGQPLRRYRPQRDYLKLVSLGGKTALAEKWGFVGSGPALWRLKDRIDRVFMDKFRSLPAMPAPQVPALAALGLAEAMGNAPPCGGCGAKVGRGPLLSALAALPPQIRDDVTALPGDDAALIGTGQVITTDHLRAVTEDPGLMTRIAVIHALGDIWAMGARPQAALLSVILPRMSPVLQARTLDEVMATAAAVLGEAGAVIAGGHTTLGAELTVGVTLTGLLDRPPLTLAGGLAGDALILTRGLGSGVILAAEMRRLAPGSVVAACWAGMVRPQADAADILQGAHAMTDVTGFGLAGHLAGLCTTSGLGAEIELSALPLLPGAEMLASQGIRSTLWEQNVAGAGIVTGASGPRGDLVFDPQTCGGLLAAVAPQDTADLIAALRAVGHDAAVIGRLTPGPVTITCR